MRVWPFAALLVYLQPIGTFPYHSFQGLAIPLAILAVQGVLSVWPRPRPALVVAALALMTLPGIATSSSVAREQRARRRATRTSCSPTSSARSTRSRTTRGRAACWRRLRRAHAPVHDRARDLRRRAVVDAGLGAARGGDARAVRGRPLTGAGAARSCDARGARFLFADCRPGLRDLRPSCGRCSTRCDRYGCATVYVLHPHAGTAVLPR